MAKGRNRAPIDVGAVIERYAAGEKLGSIAVDYNVTNQTIRNRLIEAGVALRSHGQQQHMDSLKRLEGVEVVARYTQGESLNSIAESVGVNMYTVKEFLRAQGVRLRDKSEAQRLQWKQRKSAETDTRIVSTVWAIQRDAYGFPRETTQRHYNRWGVCVKVDTETHAPLYAPPLGPVQVSPPRSDQGTPQWYRRKRLARKRRRVS